MPWPFQIEHGRHGRRRVLLPRDVLLLALDALTSLPSLILLACQGADHCYVLERQDSTGKATPMGSLGSDSSPECSSSDADGELSGSDSSPECSSSDGEDSSREMDTVKADFAFFDPKPTDFHVVRLLLKTYLDSKPRASFTGFIDLVLEQTTVDTIVKNSRWLRTKRRMEKQMGVTRGTTTTTICSVSLWCSIGEETGRTVTSRIMYLWCSSHCWKRK